MIGRGWKIWFYNIWTSPISKTWLVYRMLQRTNRVPPPPLLTGPGALHCQRYLILPLTLSLLAVFKSVVSWPVGWVAHKYFNNFQLYLHCVEKATSFHSDKKYWDVCEADNGQISSRVFAATRFCSKIGCSTPPPPNLWLEIQWSWEMVQTFIPHLSGTVLFWGIKQVSNYFFER